MTSNPTDPTPRPPIIGVSPGTDRGTIRPVTEPSVQLELTMPADTSSLGGLRLQLAMDAADSGADLDVVEELVLVASELASNVILHTDDDDYTVRLHRVDDGWMLDVSGADDLDQIPGLNGMPDPMQAGGRGLVIVRAMMDEVGFVEDAGRRWVRCYKRR